jgi:hypothetical protein
LKVLIVHLFGTAALKIWLSFSQYLNESAGNEALASIVESAGNEDGTPRTHHKSQFKIEL